MPALLLFLAASAQPPAPDLSAMEPQVAALLEDTRGAVADAPEDPAAWLAYGETLHAHGLTPEAAVCYREVVRSDPEALTALAAGYLLAHAMRGISPAESAEALETALDGWPGYVPARVLLGEIREELGDRDAALPVFRRAVADDPEAPLAAFRLGSALLAEGRAREALPLLEAALEGAPEAGAARGALARAAFAVGDRERAEALAAGAAESPDGLPHIEDPLHRRMRDRDHSSPQLLERAREARAAGRLAEAESWFRNLAAIRPRDAGMHAEWGAVLAQRGDLEAAEARYLDAVALDPEQPLARFGLGALRSRAQDYPAAEYQFRALVRARPNDAPALSALGEVLLRRGRFAEARDFLARAAERDPENGGVRVLLAAALAELGRFREAWQAAQEAVALGVQPSEEFLAALRERQPGPGAEPGAEPAAESGAESGAELSA